MRRFASLERPEGIARNTAFAYGVQITTSVFTAALTVFLVRALEPDGYGLLALALAVGGLVSIPSDLGISGSAARFVAESRTNRTEAARVVSDSLVLKMTASVVTSTALFLSADWVAAGYDEPNLAWPLRGVAVALFGHSVMNLCRAVFSALGRNSINLKLVFSESAIETGASIGLVLLGAGATGAAFGRAIGYGCGAAIGLVLVVATLGGGSLRLRQFRWPRARRLARYAGVLALVDGAWIAFTQVDALVLGAFLGAGAVGVYAAPLRLVAFLQYSGLAVATAVTPRLARSEEEPSAVPAFVASIRYLIVFQALLIAPLLVWAGPITELLLGPGYEESADVLRALTPFVFLSGVSPLLSLAANYLGEARRRVPIAVGTLAVNLALALALVPTVGIVGAAIATDVAYAIYVPAHLWICRRLLDVPLRPILISLGRAAAAATVMSGVLAAVGTSDLGLGQWIVGGIAGTASFLAVLVVTRELGRAELATLRSALGRVRS